MLRAGKVIVSAAYVSSCSSGDVNLTSDSGAMGCYECLGSSTGFVWCGACGRDGDSDGSVGDAAWSEYLYIVVRAYSGEE